MNRALAVTVASYVRDSISGLRGKYNIDSIASEGEELSGFHCFADDRDQVGSFKIERTDGKAYYFLFIDFRFLDDFYLVIYPKNKANPLLCMRKTKENENMPVKLCWKYVPARRDGKNFDRKNLFDKLYHNSTAEIDLPRNINEVEPFFDEVFRLCEARIAADNYRDDNKK